MKWVVIAGSVLVLVALASVGVGLMLPVAHTATVSEHVSAPPDSVWDAITDVERFASWRPGVTSAERVEGRNGLPAWRETGSAGPMTLEVTTWEPPRRMVARIADVELAFGGSWIYVVEPDGAGSLLTLTEDGEVYNPFFRFMSRFVLGHESTMRAYLGGLHERFARTSPAP